MADFLRTYRQLSSDSRTRTFTTVSTSGMNLPLELLDEILSYLPPSKESLRNCSLVARSWLHPSRKRLFEEVLIQDTDRQSWLDNISPTNTELLQHVCSFRFVSFDSSEYFNIGDLYVYFPSFRRLHTIELSDAHISSDIPEQIEIFSSCQRTLSSLTLSIVSLPWRSFIALIDYFPNLRNLELLGLTFEDDNINPPPLSRPLRGKLCFYLVAATVAFSDWLFAGPGIEYDELVVYVGDFSATHLQRIITACGRSLKRLTLDVCECVVSRTIL